MSAEDKKSTNATLNEFGKTLESVKAVSKEEVAEVIASIDATLKELKEMAEMLNTMKKDAKVIGHKSITELFNKISGCAPGCKPTIGLSDLSKVKVDLTLLNNFYYMTERVSGLTAIVTEATEEVKASNMERVADDKNGAAELMTVDDFIDYLLEKFDEMQETWETRKVTEREWLASTLEERQQKAFKIGRSNSESAGEKFLLAEHMAVKSLEDRIQHNRLLLDAHSDLVCGANTCSRLINGLRLSQYFLYKFGNEGLNNSLFAMCLLKIQEYVTSTVSLVRNFRFFLLCEENRFYALAGQVLEDIFLPDQLAAILKDITPEAADKLISFTAFHLYVAAIFYNSVLCTLYKPETWEIFDQYTCRPLGVYTNIFIEMVKGFFSMKIRETMAMGSTRPTWHISDKMVKRWIRVEKKVAEVTREMNLKEQQELAEASAEAPAEASAEAPAEASAEAPAPKAKSEAIPIKSATVEKDEEGAFTLTICSCSKDKWKWIPRNANNANVSDIKGVTLSFKAEKFGGSRMSPKGFTENIKTLGNSVGFTDPVAIAYCYRDEKGYKPYNVSRILIVDQARYMEIDDFESLQLYSASEVPPTCSVAAAPHASYVDGVDNAFMLIPNIPCLTRKASNNDKRRAEAFIEWYAGRFDADKDMKGKEATTFFTELSQNGEVVIFGKKN